MPQRRPSDGRLSSQHMCGMANWHPQWLQKYATTKTFMMVYGLLGTIQAMSYMYFVVTLTTLEKRFKIPSQTTGIILSGNEISQIMLSLILSYVGGQRNRPRWIAWGIVFCGLSCYILALPHFIYGGGDDVMRLTKQYQLSDEMSLGNVTVGQQLCGASKQTDGCDSLLSIVPLILIFLSQFVLGVGNTLYYSLGQTYLDDNSKKTNTPLMLAAAMSLRMIGPVFGFLLGYVSLNIFIEPGAQPLIDNKDPRWLGAWWLGWMILGTLMVLFSGLISLFPKQLPKRKVSLRNSHVPHVLRHEMLQHEERRESGGGVSMLPLGSAYSSMTGGLNAIATPHAEDLPKFKDFPKALMRLLRNKLLMYNIISGIFYLLGASGYMTFMTKYMEVQFHKSPQSATIVVGPASIIGVVVGLMASGLIISKKKPAPSKVLMWNVIVGIIYIFGQASYMFLYCGDSSTMLADGKLNVTTPCNANCGCDDVAYSPVCDADNGITYFSPCHAGCFAWNSEEKIYSNCTCLASDIFTSPATTTTPWLSNSPSGGDEARAASSLAMANILPNALQRLQSTASVTSTLPSPTPTTTTDTTQTPTSTTSTTTTTTTSTPTPTTTTTTTTTTSTPTTTTTTTSTPIPTTTTTTAATTTISKSIEIAEAVTDDELTAIDTEQPELSTLTTTPTIATTTDDELSSLRRRRRRDVPDVPPTATISSFLQPGVCLEGCSRAFWIFSIAAMIINWFGSSGRIGNILVNYRSVSTRDKSFAQGLSLMLISLFSLIPGPIIFGRLIDSTCLLWTKTCSGRNGNCQLYDQTTFRYLVNITAITLTVLGIIFDFLVWYHGRNLDLYGDVEPRVEETKRKNQTTTPLLLSN